MLPEAAGVYIILFVFFLFLFCLALDVFTVARKFLFIFNPDADKEVCTTPSSYLLSEVSECDTEAVPYNKYTWNS